MPSRGAVVWGVVASAVLAALFGPLLWDLILRHTGGGLARSVPPAYAGLHSVRSSVAARRFSSTSTSTDCKGGKP